MATFDKTAYRKNREAGRRGQGEKLSSIATPEKRLVDREGRWVSPKKRPEEFEEAKDKDRLEVNRMSGRETDRRFKFSGSKSQNKEQNDPYGHHHKATGNYKPDKDPAVTNRKRTVGQRIRSKRYDPRKVVVHD